jgi:hypothetical protein
MKVLLTVLNAFSDIIEEAHERCRQHRDILISEEVKDKVTRFIPTSRFQVGTRHKGRIYTSLKTLQSVSIPKDTIVGNEEEILLFTCTSVSGGFEITISEDTLCTLFHHQSSFMRYNYNLAMNMKCKYTLRLYLLLSSWGHNEMNIKVERLLSLLFPDGFSAKSPRIQCLEVKRAIAKARETLQELYNQQLIDFYFGINDEPMMEYLLEGKTNASIKLTKYNRLAIKKDELTTDGEEIKHWVFDKVTNLFWLKDEDAHELLDGFNDYTITQARKGVKRAIYRLKNNEITKDRKKYIRKVILNAKSSISTFYIHQ